ncbi:hypothetical protein OG985_29475 [Streptomyces sp. NBC_00289]|uniref:hypothetical protein n=1 Tax=Streptomyces sp. NBC_00289 TaxID=2975703 RepID=UPI003246A955
MKSLKAAAVVAGSMVLAGVAVPAYAQSTADLTPTSLNGAVDTLAKNPPNVNDLMPLQHQSDALNTENKGSVLNTVKGATDALNNKGGLLGGLPMRH